MDDEDPMDSEGDVAESDEWDFRDGLGWGVNAVASTHQPVVSEIHNPTIHSENDIDLFFIDFYPHPKALLRLPSCANIG